MQTAVLDDLLAKLTAMPEDALKATKAGIIAKTSSLAWVPNPGPQTEAYFCIADELLYGGQAGGGKTDLLLGLALTAQKRSLMLRRINKDAVKLVSRMAEIIGCRDGYNGQLQSWRINERQIDFGGCEYDDDKQRYKGDPHDLIAFDELSDFTEAQYTFIIGWNRSTDPAQRCRVVAASNPPTTAEGLWMIKRWAPWLDPHHPNPAVPGELRWFLTYDGDDTEVDGPGPHLVEGKQEYARSRTFIPATLDDNPDLARTNYSAVLAGLPEVLRRAYKDGDFTTAMHDDEWQVIPTHWIREAQARWTQYPPENVPMCAIGVDVAQGGDDDTVLAIRHDGWYAPLLVTPGEKTPSGAEVAGLILAHRRDNAQIIIDVGGGYGGATVEHLKINELKVTPFNGSMSSTARTSDKTLKFYNKRAEVYWRFREALDPSQAGGSQIMLPNDPELVADLTSMRIDKQEINRQGIKLESKKDVKARIGRSPDKGDAVVMAWHNGIKGFNVPGGWKPKTPTGYRPAVVLGYANRKR